MKLHQKSFILLIVLLFQTSLNAQTITWKQLASLPKGYSGGEAVVLNDKIYLITGTYTGSYSKDFYVYDPSADTWTKLADLPEARSNLAMAAVNGKIYAIGGDVFTKTNYEYTPETNTWKTLTPMPTSRQHVDCGVVGRKIYVMGGITSYSAITKKNEMYDTETDTWSEKASVPTLRNNPAIVTLDSFIYVIGGGGATNDIWKAISTVECYNTNTNVWTTKANLPFVLFKPGAILVNNKIVVLGGQNAASVSLSSILIYDAISDNWKAITSLPKINCFAGYASIGNKIYVIGGTTSEPNWTNYSDVYEGTFVENTSEVVQPEDNPVNIRQTDKGQINVSFPAASGRDARINIYNMNGLSVYSKTIFSVRDEVVDINTYPQGVYLVSVFYDGKNYNTKIAKE
jgi:N-acetylneuraminic acid mutarotase